MAHAGSPMVDGFPERVGRYALLLPIASGGMATVYLGETAGAGAFRKQVAVKVVHQHLRQEPSFCTALLEEAALTVRIQHPNVVTVLDAGEEPRAVYLVMEYVEGDSLGGLARAARAGTHQLALGVGMRVLVDALAGLHAAHELRDDGGASAGLVHRDFTPQNILVGTDGISRLTDFGIAKASSVVSSTTTGTIKGKFGYMAPEQARAEALDRRADIWAAGVIAWELIVGRRLYEGGNDANLLLAIVQGDPPAARSVDPSVPEAVSDAVRQALQSSPSDRYPTAAAFGRALSAACASCGIEIATPDEVAAAVHEVAIDRIHARRIAFKDAQHRRSDRARVPETPGPQLSSGSRDTLPSTAKHEDAAARSTLREPRPAPGPLLEHATGSDPAPTPVLSPPERTMVSARPTAEATVTAVSSVTAPAPAPAPRARARLALSFGVVALLGSGAAALLMISWSGRSKPANDDAAPGVASTAQSAPADVAPPAQQPQRTVTGSASVEAQQLALAPTGAAPSVVAAPTLGSSTVAIRPRPRESASARATAPTIPPPPPAPSSKRLLESEL